MGVVMVFKIIAVASWAAVSVASGAFAQSLAGPAEMPPVSFKGSQYVDSRGCVFLRAGIGGRVTWVPRISRDRQALCGQSPAAAAREVAVTAPKPAAPAPAPTPAAKPSTFGSNTPMETIASLPRTAVAPRAATKPAPQAPARTVIPAPQPVPPAAYSPKATHAGAGYRCPASAPVARRFALQGGGSTVMCTTAAGGIESATPPLSLGDRSDLLIPDGYRAAWTDGRLNPQRGLGTAAGQAQQDKIWTRDVPAQLAARDVKRRVVSATSTSNAARGAGRSGYYVQVGTFGEAGNAAKTAARLQGLGLPVAKSRITSKGRSLQIVMAGPFGDAGAAAAALNSARRSGFGDAFIR
jgi:hypothetical protein